jgi:hypothetical protein
MTNLSKNEVKVMTDNSVKGGARSASIVQNGGTAEASMREVGQGSVGLRHRMGGGRGSDAAPCGES